MTDKIKGRGLTCMFSDSFFRTFNTSIQFHLLLNSFYYFKSSGKQNLNSHTVIMTVEKDIHLFIIRWIILTIGNPKGIEN